MVGCISVGLYLGRKLNSESAATTLPKLRPAPRSARSPAFPQATTQRLSSTSTLVQVPTEQSRYAIQPEQVDRKGKGKACGELATAAQDDKNSTGRDGTQSTITADHTIAIRRHLMQIMANLPPKPTLSQILDARTQIKALDRLDDSTPIKHLLAIAIDQSFDDFAIRLLNESANLMLARRRIETRKTIKWMYVDVVQQLGRLKRWSSVVQVTNQALSKGLVSGPLLHSRMRGLNRQSRYSDTIATFALYEKHNLSPDGPAHDEVIEAHLLNADLPTAQAVLQEKGAKGFPTTAQTCLTLFDGMALYGGNKVMEEKVLADVNAETLSRKKAIRQDVRVLNKILSVRAGRDAARDALAMLDYYDLDRYPPALIDKLRRLPLPKPIPVSAPNVDHWRPMPDRATLVSLVGLALRQRRPDLASELLSTATARSFPVNDHLAACIVRIFITQGSIQSAEDFVFALPRGQAEYRRFVYPPFQPSSFVYESLLSGILRFRGLAGVNECFRRLTEAKQPPLKVTEGLMRALVDYLALEKMETLGVSADLLVKVKRITAGRTKPTRENLNTLLKAAWMSERLSVNEWSQLRKSIENEFPIPAEDAGLEPPQRPLPKISEILARSTSSKARRFSALTRIRDSLTDRKVRHDSNTAAHVLRNDHLIRFISAKWNYLQSQVLDLGIRPTYQHFAVLIRAYLVLGDVKGADLALRYSLNEVQIEPHVALYSTMISGLSRLGRHDVALNIYEELRATPGVEPDRQLFAALAMSCSRMRDLEGLERVLQQVRKQVESFAPAIDPGLLVQAQEQTRIRAALDARQCDLSTIAKEELASQQPLVYDPLLDPVFFTIYYRTLNLIERHLEAQQVVKSSLDRGLVPDLVVAKVLNRTGTWLRWKMNKDRRDGHSVDREETVLLYEDNVRRIRSLMRQASSKQRRQELKAIGKYWEKAEQTDVDEREWVEFFKATSTGKPRPSAQ
ncbi:uncharacterized protein JCM15063_005928 [Sporobolomyces koalae]|uniref:uncharacterized protein n=1 Tax=Sporobolomyces koalae TaxID=500713 RepID=UPI0031751075